MKHAAAVALAYAAVGLIALQLALPPVYASPMFPPAGIAVATAYLYGAPALAGVAAGSLLVDGITRAVAGELAAPALAATLAGAAGATLQAGVGAALLRRFVGQPLRLETPAEYLRFALLAGPLACVVSASVAVLAFWRTGAVAAADLWFTWWTWWTGDTMGVLIVAPVVLALFAPPRAVWAPRRATVALPLAFATVIVGAGIALSGRWERDRIDGAFRRQATDLAHSLRQDFTGHLDALHAVQGLFVASEDVTPDEFNRVTAHWLRTLPTLRALGWSPRVPAGEHAAFEARMQAVHPGYRVFDRAADGARQPPDPQREAIAVAYIEPADGNAAALGVNALSIPAARDAVERAAASSEPQATVGFRLTQEAGAQTGVVVYLAVRKSAGTPPGSTPIDGVVFATLRMDDAIHAAGDATDNLLFVCLFDETGAMAAQRLAGPEPCATEAPGRALDVPLQFAGRQWRLQVRAAAEYAAVQRSWTAWLFAVTALAATGLLGAFLLLASARTQRIRELVDERTSALRAEVAQRQAKEQALIAAERRFAEVFEAASVGLAYTDLDGRLLRVNARYCEITGRSPDELRGGSTDAFTAPEDAGADRERLRALVEGRCSDLRLRTHYVRPDGSRVPVEVAHSLSRDPDGGPRYVVVVVEDLRDRLRREAAEASSLAKTEFLSRMSHELRTPLNAMLGFAQLMQLDPAAPLAPVQRERIGHVQRAGWHLLEMINDVLDLSRIEAGALRLSLEPIDLRPLAHECAQMQHDLLRAREVRLAVEIADDACFVRADATRLRQVLSNLLSNAIKYNRRGGSVRVRSEGGAGRTVRIAVSDTGCGMDAAQLARLFEPFNRLGRERGEIEGTGIGLVIARHLVEAMNGRIDVASTAGEGSTFTVVLPAAAAPGGDVRADASPAVGSDARDALRVVYAEDNPVNVELMRGLLQLAPHPVGLQAFGTGAETLAALDAAPPDLLLLDLNLPDMSGLDLLRQLRADARLARLRVAIVSADALDEHVRAGLAAGADAYLTKPIQLGELLRLLDSARAAPVG